LSRLVRSAPAPTGRVQWAELAAPPPRRLATYDDTALKEKILNCTHIDMA
jgi:hypothetical protein